MFPAHSNFSTHMPTILQTIVHTRQLIQPHTFSHTINPHIINIIFHGPSL